MDAIILWSCHMWGGRGEEEEEEEGRVREETERRRGRRVCESVCECG